MSDGPGEPIDASCPRPHAKPLIGYCTPWNGGPGEQIELKVSSEFDSFELTLVRLAPKAPGNVDPRSYIPIQSPVNGTYPGRRQNLFPGSYIHIGDFGDATVMPKLTVHAWIQPTARHDELQAIVAAWSDDGRGFGAFLEPEGDLSLRLNEVVLRSQTPVRVGEWTEVLVSFDSAAAVATIAQRPLRELPADPATATISLAAPRSYAPTERGLVLGGHVVDGRIRGTFDGKIDSPTLFATYVGADHAFPVDTDIRSPRAFDRMLCAWDFTAEAGTPAVHSLTDERYSGTEVNHPMRGVTGRNWTGRESCFHLRRDQYNAVHFHTDDLDDADWSSTATLTVPESLPSGIYGFQLTAQGVTDLVPFFVRPGKHVKRNAVVFLAPTLSYLAYANEHSAAAVHSDRADFSITDQYTHDDWYAVENNLCGLYDLHRDGTGFCFSSWLKPIVSMRPDYKLPVARSEHQLSADLQLLTWIDAKGFTYDVLTDHDLHAGGVHALSPYATVVTGTHPEYWTSAMLEALEAYMDRGGRLMYMGGNGFYWVTSVAKGRPHLMEVRRGRRGTASWHSAAGEGHHTLTGELGGLWRDRGKPPQQLAGVGMTAQGFGPGRPYRRTDAGKNPSLAWIFDGVDGDVIGDAGTTLGAAGSWEIDRVDTAVGTALNATVLASADGFDDSYQHVVEELMTTDQFQGGSHSQLVRADIVYYPTAAGGAVFAVGSIGFCGSLLAKNGANNASALVENILRGFTENH